MEMYQEMHKWDEAIDVAEAKVSGITSWKKFILNNVQL